MIDNNDIDQIVAEVGSDSSAVIPVLQAIQEKYNYLPQPALDRVCEITDITPAAITGVATFYSQFRMRPAGRHFVKVCIGTACHVMGAEAIFEAFRQHLDIPDEEDTDKDRLFTVEKVACLGCCMLAPAVQIDDITYGFLNSQKVPGVLRDFLASVAEGAGKAASFKKRQQPPVGEARICLCSSCAASGSRDVYDAFKQQINELSLAASVKTVGCTGMAYRTPLVDIVMQGGKKFQYGNVSPQNARDILLRHFKPAGIMRRAGAVVSRALEKFYTDEAWEPVTRFLVDVETGGDAAYTCKQHHLVTESGGDMSPLDIDEYIAGGGFQALEKSLEEFSSVDIIQQIEDSGLRGRGGAGFPTAKKWTAVNRARGDKKYIVCNGDEGDPGAFMDRMILESFPFRVIEGMLIASRALGSSEGYFYIRAEYPLALQRVEEALKICTERGYLGENILDSGHSFQLNVVAGAGAFVCGEETALIAAIEGKRGNPRLRAPYPAEKGLYGQPTLVNNVETFAMVPRIIRLGPEQFASLGTESSKGAKTFALAGKIVRSGLIEVPMGTTLREIVEEIGGGIPNGGKLKAIQVGGPSGGCVPAKLADTPVDYEALTSAGAMMGSGGMVVLDDSDCMVDIARYFMAFTQNESCGKCTHCRVGTKHMLDILEALCNGEGKDGDIEKLEDLADVIREGSLCGLGRTAPNPVLSTLNHFRDEYVQHIEGRCPAKKCKALITYSINDSCIGCTRCAQTCPVKAIEMKPYEKHNIDTETCTQCDACRQACPNDAVEVN